MKSQVNALLHITRGILKDVLSTYPALKESLSKDFERIALSCRTRGITCFTLDLPVLEASLLEGLESGRLSLSGPLSRVVSKESRIPRLFSGLWLRVFNKSACLRKDADVNSIFFLRQLLTVGKKIEMECSSRRLKATIGAYHDIERSLRSPTLGWSSDRITADEPGSASLVGVESPTDDQYCYLGNSDRSGCDILLGALPKEALRRYRYHEASCREVDIPVLRSLHLLQARDRSSVWGCDLPLFMGGAEPRQSKEDADILDKIQRVADLVTSRLGPFNPLTYSGELEKKGLGTGLRHGPGAVAGRQKNWEKSLFLTWPAKLSGVFPFEWCGNTSIDRDRPINHELASRLIAVPKTAKGPRLIAAEATEHQWCQQLILRFLFDQSRKLFTDRETGIVCFIDFKDQSKSGDLVLKASLDGSLATVDLSDASDRLTCWTVERIFRSNPSLVLALHAARTRYLKDNILGVPSFLKLKKFASQGTATTFPVMSIVMLCIAIGSTIRGDVTWSKVWALRNQIRVFGDDIILPTPGYVRLARAMELLQLKVNGSKSFVQGKFRESCGTDGYLGCCVTPVKPKTLVCDGPSANQSMLDTANNLFRKGLWHASEAVLSLIPRRVTSNLLISKVGSEGLRGLASFSGSWCFHLKLRWNNNLHRYEARTWGLYSKPINKPRDGGHVFLDFVSRAHSALNPRVVSEFIDRRVAKSRYHWEPIADEDQIVLFRSGVTSTGFTPVGVGR